MAGEGLNSTPNSAVVADENIIKQEIPTVDFSILTNGTPDQRSKIIHDIGRACEEWGCFTLVNHGVPESLRTAMIDEFAGFFDLSAEERDEYKRNRPFEPIRFATSIKTMVEGADFLRDFLRIFVHPNFNSPDKPPNFRKVSEEFTRQTREIGIELLKAIYESLGLEESCFEADLQPKGFNQVLYGNSYPPCGDQPEQNLRLPTHSDPFILTILMQKGSGGSLQLKPNDNWIVFEPTPKSFLILVGDVLEIISNGKYKSLLHRVVLNGESSRISVLSLIGPALDQLVTPLPKLVERCDGSAAFRSITFKEYIQHHQRDETEQYSLNYIRL